MQPGQLEVNTPTLKNDRHFLLVDDKVSLEEDAENDPCDLHRQRETTEQHVRQLSVKIWRRRHASAEDRHLEM